jgi:tartrate-resistant acid phosphatase type 5
MFHWIATLFSLTMTGASFLSVGDWGSAMIGGSHLEAAQAVASQMSKEQDSASFVLNTGDNFYYCGIQNVSDP